MSGRAGHGWWPFLLPLASFLVLGEIGRRFPDSWEPVFFVLCVAVPAGLFLAWAARGSYPELRGYPDAASGALLDVAVGVLGAALWMAPYVVWLRAVPEGWAALPGWLQPGTDAPFDPGLLGPGLGWLALGIRGLGYAGVTPFVEELFVRGWLSRFAEVYDRPVDFRDVPVGRYHPRSLLVVALFFTFSHVSWEWPVALLWILGTQLWFYHRRNLMALVVVHAASNLSILLAVPLWSGRLAAADGTPIDLWFFL
jgi:membrane protease YdiL (CAAX protease family)